MTACQSECVTASTSSASCPTRWKTTRSNPEERLEAELREHADRRRQASAFDVRWGGTANRQDVDPAQTAWQAGWGDLRQGACAPGCEKAFGRGMVRGGRSPPLCSAS